ncbi:hypothetical protein T4D_11267 [Trichinella pseudospiralis]|uniref:Uncharacterized protein n=1 Tax=Trichinella pseudospiralis TaxID=6337 RepID=A0A0V1FAN5_TRIPS|nr:hypothetical protein T4D_11267 [Trichinella pseudospiralis]
MKTSKVSTILRVDHRQNITNMTKMKLIENSTDGRKRLRIIIEKRRISITWMNKCSSVELHAYNAQFFRMNKFIENSQHFSPNRKDTKIKINEA